MTATPLLDTLVKAEREARAAGRTPMHWLLTEDARRQLRREVGQFGLDIPKIAAFLGIDILPRTDEGMHWTLATRPE